MTVDEVNRFFDGVLQADREAHLRRQQLDIEATLAGVGTTCGDCRLWMTRACPQEANVNGWNRGPSCAAPKCGAFEERPEADDRRGDLRGRLRALRI